MKNFRTQFEIRYFSILTFRENYRDIVAPFITKSIFTINNGGNADEYITFTNKELNVHYDVRWDRLIVLVEGDNRVLMDHQGPLFIMHQIFEKIKKLQHYVRVTSTLYDRAVLIETKNENLAEVKRNFAEKYLKDFDTYNNGGEETDIAIVENVALDESNEIAFARSFGPFNYQNDVANYRLSPIHNKPSTQFKDLSGILVTSTYTRKLKLNTLDVVSSFKLSNTYFEESVKKMIR